MGTRSSPAAKAQWEKQRAPRERPYYTLVFVHRIHDVTGGTRPGYRAHRAWKKRRASGRH